MAPKRLSMAIHHPDLVQTGFPAANAAHCLPKVLAPCHPCCVTCIYWTLILLATSTRLWHFGFRCKRACVGVTLSCWIIERPWRNSHNMWPIWTPLPLIRSLLVTNPHNAPRGRHQAIQELRLPLWSHGPALAQATWVSPKGCWLKTLNCRCGPQKGCQESLKPCASWQLFTTKKPSESARSPHLLSLWTAGTC